MATLPKCRKMKVGLVTYHFLFDGEIAATDEDRDRVRDSVEEEGKILEPIVCWKEHSSASDEWVIDGIGRVEISHDKGFDKVPRRLQSAKNIDEAREINRTLNFDRRQTPISFLKERKEARKVRIAEASKNGQSTRDIAEAEGVSQTTVVNDLAEIQSEQGCSPESNGQETPQKGGNEESNGAQSAPDENQWPENWLPIKAYREANPDDSNKAVAKELGVSEHVVAKVKKRMEQDSPAREDAKQEESKEDPQDEVGHALTADSRAAFENLSLWKEAWAATAKLQKLIDQIVRIPGGEQLAKQVQATGSGDNIIHKLEHLNALKRVLSGTRPHSVCPYCVGKGNKTCKGCSGNAWVSRITWNDADDATKARLS